MSGADVRTCWIQLLPTELLIHIFEYVVAPLKLNDVDRPQPDQQTSRAKRRKDWRKRTSTVLSMHLVCHGWTPLARVLLWRDIHLGRESAVTSLLASSFFGQFETERLSLDGGAGGADEDCITHATALGLLEMLQGVEQLEMVKFVGGDESGRVLMDELWSIPALAKLKTLDLSHVYIPPNSRAPLNSSFSLQRLKLHVISRARDVSYPFFRFICHSLSAFEIDGLELDEEDHFIQFLISIGSTLNHFTWHRLYMSSLTPAFSHFTAIETLQLYGRAVVFDEIIRALPMPPTLKRLYVEPGVQMMAFEKSFGKTMELKQLGTLEEIRILKGGEELKGRREIEERLLDKVVKV